MPDPNPTSGLAMKLGAVVLAAGASYRMGGAKQFLEVEGRPLLVRTLDAVARSGAHPIAVVLGANAGAIRTLIDESSVVVVINPDWASGMASSIRSGISALIAEAPALEAVLVTPCDQPALSADVIRQLVELNHRTGLIAAARYNGRVGAPAVFGSRHLGAIMALKGDEGARRLLNSGPLEVSTVDLPELGFDIDTPADYAAWKAKHG